MRDRILGSVVFVILTSFSTQGLESAKKPKASLVRLPSGPRTGSGFGFASKGMVPILDKKGDKHNIEMDFYWDHMGHGLLANNVANGRSWTGSAELVDLGRVALDDVKAPPKMGWKKAVLPIKGHTYCVKDASGRLFGHIHIIEYDECTEVLVFSWRVLPIKKPG